jgi:hypothetical protein
MCWKFNLSIHMSVVLRNGAFGLDEVIRLEPHDGTGGFIRKVRPELTQACSDLPHDVLGLCHDAV